MSILGKPKSLKYKLAVSHISMIIIPLLLLGMAELIWHHIVITRYSPPEEPKIETVLKQNTTLVSQLDNLISNNPDKLMQAGYLAQLNRQAGKRFFLVLVEKDGDFVYVPEPIDKMELKAASLELQSGISPDLHGYLLIKYRDLKLSDKSIGHIYFLTKDKPSGPDKDLLFIIALLLGMIINVFISYRVANNIIIPLGILNQATAEISQGKLDHAIESSSDDEVGDLCQSFEKMRLQLKEAHSLSQRYEQNRKELIANISHDLKTPITSIRGYVQGIMEGIAKTPEKESKYIQIIYNNAVQLDRLIDELFLFSKLDLNQLEFDFEYIRIEEYLRDCVEDKGYDLENKGIKLDFISLYSSHALVWADRQKLQRVINNIIVNAEQHQDPSKERALLNIILSESSEEAVIEIKDNGRGICADKLPYIFDRLYRGDPSRGRQNQGSGLGLSIARQIIEAHGGSIWAESKVGAGTSIFFTLKKTASADTSTIMNGTGEISK